MSNKFQELFSVLEISAFELVAWNSNFQRDIRCVFARQYVIKQFQDFSYYQDRIFWTEVLSEWSKNITKPLPFTLQNCFRPFNMLTLPKCSDTGLFRHLRNNAFCSLEFRKYISYEVHLCFRIFKILC